MQFRRTTLLRRSAVAVIVSTIGRMKVDEEFHRIMKFAFVPLGVGGHNGLDYRYYETMVWHAEVKDEIVNCDIARGAISVKSRNAISWVDDTTDALAKQMHEMVVVEMIGRLEAGETFVRADPLCPYN